MPSDLQKATPKPENSLILASTSPRRKELLSHLIKDFKIVKPEVLELKKHEKGPQYLVLENAKLKSLNVASLYPENWVLGADTTVALGNEVFGKPSDMDEAKSMLLRLSGRTHQVYTGICLINQTRKISHCETVSTMVTFKRLSASIIEDYFAKVDPLDKAGAYAIQSNAEMILELYNGSLSNVIGLPKEHLQIWLKMYKLV